ncbi:unnamed protein product [Strongylus vulgaris]|uniref:Uncharacterized protein n=1 Tax=Strongylus vulgaris TaxID=40348 RepID=A0A3P7L8W4_STRVU|nr:unnamed protein product [Strongylus vulgaris]
MNYDWNITADDTFNLGIYASKSCDWKNGLNMRVPPGQKLQSGSPGMCSANGKRRAPSLIDPPEPLVRMLLA